MTIYRRRVLCQHFVRAMQHARAQFEALISERDFWKGKARELEQALAWMEKEAARFTAERDASYAASNEATRRHREARQAMQVLIDLYEQRERERRYHNEFVHAERDPMRRLH